jgi:arylsulfatase
MNHFNPVLFENRNLVPTSTDPNYYLTTDLADHAISWVRKVKKYSRPISHSCLCGSRRYSSPHQVPKEWIDKFKGKFDMGWDAYREQALERQKKLGVVPANTN